VVKEAKLTAEPLRPELDPQLHCLTKEGQDKEELNGLSGDGGPTYELFSLGGKDIYRTIKEKTKAANLGGLCRGISDAQ